MLQLLNFNILPLHLQTHPLRSLPPLLLILPLLIPRILPLLHLIHLILQYLLLLPQHQHLLPIELLPTLHLLLQLTHLLLRHLRRLPNQHLMLLLIIIHPLLLITDLLHHIHELILLQQRTILVLPKVLALLPYFLLEILLLLGQLILQN